MYFERAIRCPKESFFLLGPRGTGKSTWLRHQLPQASRIDLLDERQRYLLMTSPGAFARQLQAVPPGSWVVVDEIQKMPELLNEVHRFIEERQLKFALCGSSARKLRMAGVNLLAGRALSRGLYPFMPDELGDQFDLERVLCHGSLPVAWASEEKAEKLSAYIMAYLKEEIQAEARIRNLPGFARFLMVAAVLHGQAVNVSNISRECGISKPTIEGYLEILEQTLLCFRLNAYDGRLRLRERCHPKFFWVDPGLVRAAKQQLQPALAAEERGHLFEGLVGTTLMAYRDYRRCFDDLRYWAAGAGNVEVDFLAIRGDEMVAVEVKSGAVFQESWCKGLRAFGTPPGMLRRIIVCPEAAAPQRTNDGIEIIAYRDFAAMLHNDAFFQRLPAG